MRAHAHINRIGGPCQGACARTFPASLSAMVGAAATSGRTGSGAADERLAAWSALLRVHAALVPMLEQELAAAHAMPLSWYDVLLELNSAPERRLRMSEL